MSDEPAAVTYASYLALDEVLGAQRPRSDEHDEHLFIVVHQVYELWFKQLLHELGHLRTALEAGETSPALHTLRRMLTILKVAVAQIDVLETMTPRQFTSFRARLDRASGFQSAQFRRLEGELGDGLWSSFLAYLGAQGHPVPPDRGEDTDHADVGSVPADVEAVLVAVYEADGVAAQVAERLVDLDEGLQEWRYRHVKMVERTIGDRGGTGGSSGVTYLRTTIRPLYPALWSVRRRL